MKAKVRTFNGTTSPEVTQRETDHRKLAREAAAEGFVLLENKDHFLPLAKGRCDPHHQRRHRFRRCQ